MGGSEIQEAEPSPRPANDKASTSGAKQQQQQTASASPSPEQTASAPPSPEQTASEPPSPEQQQATATLPAPKQGGQQQLGDNMASSSQGEQQQQLGVLAADGDLAEYTPFANGSPVISGGSGSSLPAASSGGVVTPSGSGERPPRPRTRPANGSALKRHSSVGGPPHPAGSKTGVAARQVSWHDYHGKELTEVREYAPSEKESEDGDAYWNKKPCCVCM